MPLSITIVELLSCGFGVTDGWFNDPIGLLARAYILVPLIALGKSLLARAHLDPEIKLLPNPRAYASSSHWLLLSIIKPHSHAPLWHINNPPQYAYVLFSDGEKYPMTQEVQLIPTLRLVSVVVTGYRSSILLCLGWRTWGKTSEMSWKNGYPLMTSFITEVWWLSTRTN